jgi:uncharacterized membrane-anchored protein
MNGPTSNRPTPPDKPIEASAWAGPGQRIAALSDYFVAHAERFTPEALREAAAESGFATDEIDEAYRRAIERQRADESVRPIRQRARRIVLAAYGLVYLAFAVLFLTSSNRYGGGVIALIILTIVLGIALLISVTWVNRRRPTAQQLEGALLTMLAVPLVVLVAVAGLCVASASPGAFGLF